MAWSKLSRQARGYGAEWDRLRKVILQRDGYLCQCDACTKANRIKAATEVDHRIPKAKGGTDDPANLQAINADCHKAKTIAEKGGTQRARIGVDGWPV